MVLFCRERDKVQRLKQENENVESKLTLSEEAEKELDLCGGEIISCLHQISLTQSWSFRLCTGF